MSDTPTPTPSAEPLLTVEITLAGARALVAEIARVLTDAPVDVKGARTPKLPALIGLQARLLRDPGYLPPPPKEAA